MAGRMGGDHVSVRTMVLETNEQLKTLAVKGPVPGAFGGIVRIFKTENKSHEKSA